MFGFLHFQTEETNVNSNNIQVFELTQQNSILGSDTISVDILLRKCKDIANSHCRISKEGSEYCIEDLGSTTGTFRISADGSLQRFKVGREYEITIDKPFLIGNHLCCVRNSEMKKPILPDIIQVVSAPGQPQQSNAAEVQQIIQKNDLSEVQKNLSLSFESTLQLDKNMDYNKIHNNTNTNQKIEEPQNKVVNKRKNFVKTTKNTKKTDNANPTANQVIIIEDLASQPVFKNQKQTKEFKVNEDVYHSDDEGFETEANLQQPNKQKEIKKQASMPEQQKAPFQKKGKVKLDPSLPERDPEVIKQHSIKMTKEDPIENCSDVNCARPEQYSVTKANKAESNDNMEIEVSLQNQNNETRQAQQQKPKVKKQFKVPVQRQLQLVPPVDHPAVKQKRTLKEVELKGKNNINNKLKNDSNSINQVFEDVASKKNDNDNKDLEDSQEYNQKKKKVVGKLGKLKTDNIEMKKDAVIEISPKKITIKVSPKKQKIVQKIEEKNIKKEKIKQKTKDKQMVPDNTNIIVVPPQRQVLFSGFRPSQRTINDLKKIKVPIVQDITENSILVQEKFNRTIKLLTSINKGIPIVSMMWVSDSIDQGKALNDKVNDYIIKDKEAETKYNFSLKKSILKRQGKEDGFLVNQTFFIWMPPEDKICGMAEMRQLIESAGGKVIPELPNGKIKGKNTFFVVHEDNGGLAEELYAKGAKVVYNPEFIKTGILRQHLDLHEKQFIIQNQKIDEDVKSIVSKQEEQSGKQNSTTKNKIDYKKINKKQ